MPVCPSCQDVCEVGLVQCPSCGAKLGTARVMPKQRTPVKQEHRASCPDCGHTAPQQRVGGLWCPRCRAWILEYEKPATGERMLYTQAVKL